MPSLFKTTKARAAPKALLQTLIEQNRRSVLIHRAVEPAKPGLRNSKVFAAHYLSPCRASYAKLKCPAWAISDCASGPNSKSGAHAP